MFGGSAFQEGQVNQWISFAETAAVQIGAFTDMLTKMPKNLEEKVFLAARQDVQNIVKDLERQLKGKKFVVGDKVTLADLALVQVLQPVFQLVLDEKRRKAWGLGGLTKWFESITKLPQFAKAAGKIHMCGNAAIFEGRFAKEGGKKKEAPKKEADEFDDLFGGDDDAPAEKVVIKKKAKKEKPPAMSIVFLEVKPLDAETDLSKVAARIFADIVMDGLFWKTEFKKEPIAFGIEKLIIAFSCEDEKVSVDSVVEKIEEFDDVVQSVEIASFNKI